MARADKGKAAYFIVDTSSLPDEHRAEILEDAFDGGSQFGLKIVEEYINGPARQPVYGVYYGEDEKKWEEAKADFGFAAEEADDSVRQAAEAKAVADGENARAAEDAAVEAVVNPPTDDGSSAPVVNKAKR